MACFESFDNRQKFGVANPLDLHDLQRLKHSNFNPDGSEGKVGAAPDVTERTGAILSNVVQYSFSMLIMISIHICLGSTTQRTFAFPSNDDRLRPTKFSKSSRRKNLSYL